MPSFFRRLFGFSFRTERLIMNIIGLINSTFEWSPLKWTNELEQIQNISLTYGTLILGTIGEDTIKTVLSWIVITRIVIAHVYTFTYLTNMYPILTWSRPNLLLPWLILSFFKNVVLEVIVLAVCLLYWYDKRFSLAIFLEFVLVKIVPLIVATYNWYSTSCLFLELRHAEKMTKLKRNLRSETNFLTSRLFTKIADSKYRSRSLITLLSYESYETVDTQDTISRIIDDPDLTPVQKTMKILGITQQDVTEARSRRRERAVRRRLTEIDDEHIGTEKSGPRKFFTLDDEYEEQIGSFLERKDDLAIEHSTMIEQVSSPSEDTKQGTKFQFSEQTEPIRFEEADIVSKEPKKEIVSATRQTNETHRSEQCASNLESASCLTNERDCTKLGATTFRRKHSIENNCNCPKEARSLFNCDCSIDEKLFEETKEHCCLSANEVVNEIVPMSSTPKGCPADIATAKTNSKSDRRENEFRSCTYDRNFLNEKTNYRANGDAVSPIEDRDLSRNDPKISEEINGKPCSRRLIAKEKLKEEVEQVTSKMGNLEISDRKMLVNVSETKEEKNGRSESKTVEDDSRAKTLIVDEDLKQRVLSVTNKIDSILRNFKYGPPSRRSLTEQQRAENRIEENNPGVPVIGVHKLSTFLEDTIRKPVPLTNVRMPATIDSIRGTSPTRKGHRRYESDRVEGNRSTVNLPEYSFGDTSIQRFFEDSMKVFDGCYEQDFDSNSELQCIYRQLEKNKWNPFVGRSNLETTPLKRDDEIARNTVQGAPRHVFPSANAREKMEMERSKITAASLPKSVYRRENLISRQSQVNGQFYRESSRRKPASPLIPTKSCYVQTDHLARPPSFDKPFERVVADTKNRKKTSLKRKRIQDQVSVSTIRDHRDDKAETRYFPNCHQAQKRNKQHYDPKKVADSPESDRSVCECKMQQLEAKCSPSSESSSSSNKKDDRRRGKLDSFGTVTLSRVTRNSESKEGGFAHRKKPPICPTKAKPKIPFSRIAPIMKKLEESKRSNANGQNAREMRALKAYNEATLLRDKEHFDAKRKVFSNRTTVVELLPEQTKHRTRSKKSNSGKKISQDSKLVGDVEYVDKENLSVEQAATASTSNDDKSVSEFFASTNENYVCSNLSKVNRVTDKIFDRLFRVRGQSREKSRSATDADIRKQFSKYSNPKQMLDEQILSASSSKRLEGMQTGRELERTPAKEDIRDRFTAGIEKTNEGGKNVEKQHDRSLSTIKASVNQDVASTWSCNSIDRTDETLAGYARTEAPLFTEDTRKDSSPEERGMREEISGTKGNESEADIERDNGNVESFEDDENDEGSGANISSRNIDVSYLVHGVVLSNANANANADTSKQPRLRDIVDDATSRLLHNAFSYRSMDSIFDFAEESLVANDIANNSHSNPLDDDFVCRSSNDAVDVFTDEIPVVSRALDNLEHSVPTVVRESRQLSEREESCVREDEHLTRENVRRVGVDEFRLDDVPSSIGQLLRTLNVDGFGLENVDELGFGILRDLSRQDDVEEVQPSIVAENDVLEEEDNEERSEEIDRTLRFIEENLFTNIKFPIVINWSDSLAVSNETLLERSNSMLVRQIERTKQVRSLSFDRLNEERKMVEGGEIATNIFGKLELSSELERSSRGTSDSELVGSCKSICSEQILTDTCRLTKYFESDEITMSASRSEEKTVGKVEKRCEEKNIEVETIEFRFEEETARIDESKETDKNTRRLVEYEDGKGETIEVAELNEQVSWASVAVIVLMVCWLYIRHFWQTIISSNRSSSLKPFEIHAVPAPTVSLLERIADDQKEESKRNLLAESANFEATKISSDIRETDDHRSEEVEKEVEEGMLFLGKHLSENVRIPSFSNSDQEKTRTDLSSIACTIVDDVETMSEQIASKTENEQMSVDLRAAEQEIRTFRFEEATDDDSGSSNSFEHDEQTTLFVDDSLVRAEATIDEDVLAKKIERIEEEHVRSDDGDPRGNKEDRVEDAEDRRFSKDETIGTGGKLEEAEVSTEKKERSSVKIVESKLQNIDSFDSTYSEISDASKRTVSGFDESSMEEFHTAFNEDN